MTKQTYEFEAKLKITELTYELNKARERIHTLEQDNDKLSQLKKYEPFLKLGDATASTEAQRQHVLGDAASRLRLIEKETVNETHESNASWRSRTTDKVNER